MNRMFFGITILSIIVVKSNAVIYPMGDALVNKAAITQEFLGGPAVHTGVDLLPPLLVLTYRCRLVPAICRNSHSI